MESAKNRDMDEFHAFRGVDADQWTGKMRGMGGMGKKGDGPRTFLRRNSQEKDTRTCKKHEERGTQDSEVIRCVILNDSA